jgi:hypothetical protein
VLRRHDVVGAAVGLARDDGELGHRRLGEGVEQLGAVLDDAADSCAVPGRNPGTSTKVTSGMLKQSQKRTKRAALTEASMSRQPARCAGWLATRPTGGPSSGAKPQDVGRVLGLDLEEAPLVDDAREHRPHVVGLGRDRAG